MFSLSVSTPATGRNTSAVIENSPAMKPASVSDAPSVRANFGRIGITIMKPVAMSVFDTIIAT